jgi:hypothetical protein
MPFQFNRKSSVLKIEPKKGTADDAVVSVDVKFRTEAVPVEAIAAALGAETTDEVAGAFHRPLSVDADRNVAFLGLKSIAAKQAWEGKHTLALAGQRPLRCVRVGQITVIPRGKATFDCTWSASIEKPTKGWLEQVAEMIHRDVALNLEQDADLDLKVTPGARPQPTRITPAKAPRRGPRKAVKMKARKRG